MKSAKFHLKSTRFHERPLARNGNPYVLDRESYRMPVPEEDECPKVDSELKSKLESFDKSKLKATKTEVKNTLPDKEGK